MASPEEVFLIMVFDKNIMGLHWVKMVYAYYFRIVNTVNLYRCTRGRLHTSLHIQLS